MSGNTVYLLHMERNAKSGLPALWGLEDSTFGILTHSGDLGSGMHHEQESGLQGPAILQS